MAAPQHPHGTATIDELQHWVADRIDEANAVIGVQQWRMLLDHTEGWPADADRIFERSFLPRCAEERDGEIAGHVQIHLVGEVSDADPRSLAEQLRSSWHAAGWLTAQISDAYFRADREDGSRLIVEGSVRPGGNRLVLIVQSACTSDGSLLDHLGQGLPALG